MATTVSLSVLQMSYTEPSTNIASESIWIPANVQVDIVNKRVQVIWQGYLNAAALQSKYTGARVSPIGTKIYTIVSTAFVNLYTALTAVPPTQELQTAVIATSQIQDIPVLGTPGTFSSFFATATTATVNVEM